MQVWAGRIALALISHTHCLAVAILTESVGSQEFLVCHAIFSFTKHLEEAGELLLALVLPLSASRSLMCSVITLVESSVITLVK